MINEANVLESLGQVSATETGQVFRDFLRGHVREMICEVMAAEVTQHCGPKHDPSPNDTIARWIEFRPCALRR